MHGDDGRPLGKGKRPRETVASNSELPRMPPSTSPEGNFLKCSTGFLAGLKT